jgi:hypothetical protein
VAALFEDIYGKRLLFVSVSLVSVIGRLMELQTVYLPTVWVDEPPEFITALLIDDVTILFDY